MKNNFLFICVLIALIGLIKMQNVPICNDLKFPVDIPTKEAKYNPALKPLKIVSTKAGRKQAWNITNGANNCEFSY